MIELPEWERCSRKASSHYERMTILEKFIYDNEPSGVKEVHRFRIGLEDLLNELPDGE